MAGVPPNAKYGNSGHTQRTKMVRHWLRSQRWKKQQNGGRVRSADRPSNIFFWFSHSCPMILVSPTKFFGSFLEWSDRISVHFFWFPPQLTFPFADAKSVHWSIRWPHQFPSWIHKCSRLERIQRASKDKIFRRPYQDKLFHQIINSCQSLNSNDRWRWWWWWCQTRRCRSNQSTDIPASTIDKNLSGKKMK